MLRSAAKPDSQQAKPTKKKRAIGHYEILGETYAKFEFYENGWHPYSRFLDVDKIDFVLRKRDAAEPIYREVQVKFGKLYDCGVKWEQNHFDVTSWRFFRPDEFADHIDRSNFFVAYVLAHDTGYAGDIFIFTVSDFQTLIDRAISSGKGKKMYLSRLKHSPHRWILRTQSGAMTSVNENNSLDVTQHHRNFDILK